jgi:hypothetical protein
MFGLYIHLTNLSSRLGTRFSAFERNILKPINFRAPMAHENWMHASCVYCYFIEYIYDIYMRAYGGLVG